MKKYLLALILAVASVSSFASGVTVGVEYGRTTDKVDTVAVTPGIVLNDVTYDFKLTEVRQDSSFAKQSAEIRVKQELTVFKGVGVSLRGGVGKAYASDTSATYYSVEPALKLNLTKALALNTSYKYTNTFSHSDSLARTDTAFVGADLSLTQNDLVSLKAYKEFKSGSDKGFTVAYTRLF